MRARLLFLSLSAGLLSSCSVKFPDIKVHSVAGRLQAGMDWAYTGHDETGEIGMADAVKFLEGGALCMASTDYLRLKTAIEQACYKLGNACTFEAISETTARISALQGKSRRK